MINFKNANFVLSAPSLALAPKDGLKEVLVVGKSNVGKSSLINNLTTHKQLAFTSSKPGHTRLLNYYNIDNNFYLVDAPGYGYAKGGVDLDRLFGEMMEDYFKNATHLKLVLLLLDSRRELSENDLEILEYIKNNDINYLLVITKIDKINQSERAKLLKHLANSNVDLNKITYTSALKPASMDDLKRRIEQAL